MGHDRYITIKVAYDSHSSYGRSLQWIAPELNEAGLNLIEDRRHDPRPSRTWAGAVDEDTFRRFADAWRLDHEVDDTFTLDGMNWEVGGASPVVYVCVHIGAAPDGRGAKVAYSFRSR
jgi:hypothetical protein